MIPKTIKVGPITYTVIRDVHDLHRVESDGKKTPLHGQVEWKPQCIEIAANQGSDVQVVVLWHEILHAILNNAGQFDESESYIVALSHGLVQVMRDNPALMELTIGTNVPD